MYGQRVLISLEITGHPVTTRLFVCTFIVSRIKKCGRKLPCLLFVVFACFPLLLLFLLDYKTERGRERGRQVKFLLP